MINKNNNLGCGKRFKNLPERKQREVDKNTDCDFICGIPNGWGKETLCISCDFNLKEKWRREGLGKNDN